MSLHLDLDVLRTLATGMDLGSFAKAADRLGRSQSPVGRNAELLDRFDRGELDLILVLSPSLDRPRVTPILNLPMAWIGARDLPFVMPADGLKLVMFETPCVFRRAAAEALEVTDMPW